jgi:hypothetical protein
MATPAYRSPPASLRYDFFALKGLRTFPRSPGSSGFAVSLVDPFSSAQSDA